MLRQKLPMPTSLRLARHLKPYRWLIVLAPLLMTLEVVLNLLQPRLVQRIVDVGIARLDLAEVLRTGLLMVGTSVVAAIGGMTNGICAELVSQGFGVDVRESLFRRVQAFSFADLDGMETGQLVTRLTNDVTQVQEAIVMVLRMMVRAPLLLVGSLVMGILTAPRLAFLPLALMPVELAALAWIVARATPMFTRVQERLDRVNETLQENLAGVRVVKAFVRAASRGNPVRERQRRPGRFRGSGGPHRGGHPALPDDDHEPGGDRGAVVRRRARHAGRHDHRPDHLLRQLPDDRALVAHDGEPARDHARPGRRLEPSHPGGARHRAGPAGSRRAAGVATGRPGRVRGRHVRLRRRRAGAARGELHRRSGTDRGHPRRHGLGQVQPRAPHPPFLRRERGPHPGRRHRRTRPQAGGPAPGHRHRPAGDRALQRHRARQHPLGPARGRRTRR